MAEWQPIETAPTRGEVLVFFPWTGIDYPDAPKGFIFVARWREHDDQPGGAWVDSDCAVVGKNPTHWMPLPAPPRQGEE